MNPIEIGLKLTDLTPIQNQYYKDDSRFMVVAAGRRSRKTLIGRKKALIRAMKKPGRYFYGAPTHKQAKEIFWDVLKKQIQYLEIGIGRPSESDRMIRIQAVGGESQIYVLGLDQPARIEGQPWHGCHITEVPNIKQEAWGENIRPVLSDTNGWAILDGVPDMRHPHYQELAEYAAGGRIPQTYPELGGFAKSLDKEWSFYTWFSSDVLDAKEIEAAKDHLDEKVYLQEYEGSFQTAQGIIFYAYGLHNETDKEFVPNIDTYLCYDFNINPMSVVIIQEHEGNFYAVKEFIEYDSNTPAMNSKVIEYLKNNGHTKELNFTCELAGNNRNTTSGVSNRLIVEDQFKDAGFKIDPRIFRVKSVEDRFSALNGAFKNYKGITRLFINTKKCSILDKNLTKVTRKDYDNGDVRNVTHAPDAASYFAFNYLGFYNTKASTL